MVENNFEELSVDVCIIGGAGAGLVAAVRAKECGVQNIVVLEKMKSLGGCTRMAFGIFSVESPVQKRLGLHYTADECFQYHMDTSNWHCDAKLVRNWMLGTGKVIGWLEEKGCPFVKVVSFNGPHLRKFYHQMENRTGYEIVQVLKKICQEKNIDLRTNTRATKLLTDDTGSVVGVIATQGDKQIKISAKSVIIATGSISSNKELISRFYPNSDFDDVKIMAELPHNTGDGLIMAEEIGAASSNVGIMFIGPHNHPHNEQTGVLMRRPHLIKVNRNGERFVNESISVDYDWSWMLGISIDRQPSKICYALMDESILRGFQTNKQVYALYEDQASSAPLDPKAQLEKTPEKIKEDLTAWLDTVDNDIRSEMEAGRAKIAADLDEIADWIGADPEVLKTTVANYNYYCRNQYDAEFLKNPKYLLPINTPPYYAFKAYSGIDSFNGGLRINHHMEVLNKELYPIKGLYAAGVVAGDWVGIGSGFLGSEMSFTTYSGYVAGEEVAKFLKNKE